MAYVKRDLSHDILRRLVPRCQSLLLWITHLKVENKSKKATLVQRTSMESAASRSLQGGLAAELNRPKPIQRVQRSPTKVHLNQLQSINRSSRAAICSPARDSRPFTCGTDRSERKREQPSKLWNPEADPSRQGETLN